MISIYSPILSQKFFLNRLMKLGNTQTYSSPFYRVLQTIEPLVTHSNLSVKIEYALYEYLHPLLFTKDIPVYTPLPEWQQRFQLDSTYIPIIQPHDLKMGEEKTKEVVFRLKKFLNFLYQTYSNTSEVILIASHKYILEQILNIINHPDKDRQIQMGDIIQIT